MFLQSSSSSLPSDPYQTLHPSSPPPPPSPPQAADLFTDVFSTSPSPPPPANETTPTDARADRASAAPAEPSDVPRLRATHITAGYRDGVATAKASALQGGFDEGYPLGAAMGLRIGQILGVLDGLSTALDAARRRRAARVQGSNGAEESTEWREFADEAAAACLALYAQAQEELGVGNVFGKDYWSEDGTWSYEVEVRPGQEQPLFEDVVSGHPVVRAWERKVSDLMKRFGLSGARWEGEEWEDGRIKEDDAG